MNEFYDLLKDISNSIIEGNKDVSVDLTNKLINLNCDAKGILNDGLLPGMEVVGTRFRDNKIFVPQVLISARAMKSSLAILEPLLSEGQYIGLGTVVIGTVKGDIHDIGKNIVAMMLKSNGFSVIDLGINITVEKFIETVKKENALILGMSALLTTTMGYMKTVIEKVKQENIPVKVIVGGAPVSKSFADQVGADGFANNAFEAVMLARKLAGITV